MAKQKYTHLRKLVICASLPQLQLTKIIDNSGLTLEYARECLRNAIYLISVPKTEGEGAESEGATEAGKEAGKEIDQEKDKLRAACYLDLAYISLALNDPELALSYASHVLSSANPAPDHLRLVSA